MYAYLILDVPSIWRTAEQQSLPITGFLRVIYAIPNASVNLERNETRLARNETRGGNLPLSGTVFQKRSVTFSFCYEWPRWNFLDSLPITTENVVCFQFMKCCFRSFDSKDSNTIIRNYLSEGISEAICYILIFVTSVKQPPKRPQSCSLFPLFFSNWI